jgi:predicted DsbA family dithiol-disulfide isomerase
MMKLEMFFDYTCPFCLKGYQYLCELLPDFPEIEMVWRPCEAHPRPEIHGHHSDLCIQGMFFAAEQGIPLWPYHERMYDLCLHSHINIENIDELAANVGDLLNAETFKKSLEDAVYQNIQLVSNDYAYEQNNVWFLPAFRMNGLRLDAEGGIGVLKEQLRKFIAQE